MPQGIVKPLNQIVAYGDPLTVEMEVGANATAAKIVPGRAVIFDDSDETVKEAVLRRTTVLVFWKWHRTRRKARTMQWAIRLESLWASALRFSRFWLERTLLVVIGL